VKGYFVKVWRLNGRKKVVRDAQALAAIVVLTFCE
jgi:hypothetical protein